jgi:hypothetical protein
MAKVSECCQKFNLTKIQVYKGLHVIAVATTDTVSLSGCFNILNKILSKYGYEPFAKYYERNLFKLSAGERKQIETEILALNMPSCENLEQIFSE